MSVSIYVCIYMSVYICLYIYLWMLRNECPWNSRHLMTRKIAHPRWGSTHDLSITYRVPFIVIMSQIIKTMHLKYISIYQGLQTKKLYMKMTKIWIADVRWQPFWLLWFVEKRCSLQLGIRQKWIQHKKSNRNKKWSTFPQKCLQFFF